jgi:DNA-binding HxlR family transcriptional regulator
MKPSAMECDVENVLRLIGGRWKVLLLREFAAGPCRHGRLLRAIPGITQKMLTQRLRELEGKGLLDRRGFLEGRVKVVEYSLTPWGKKVMAMVFHIHDWAVANRSYLAR